MKKLAAATFAIVLSATSVASAGDPAAAQVQFDRALAAFEAGRTDEACELFAESNRLDPANGTLLNLARCHEKQGRVATAWAEYTDVATVARRAGDNARANVAAEAAARLAKELPTLTIVIADAPPGVTVIRDGVTLTSASLGNPLPIDPGKHQIEVRAPGHEPYSTEVDIAPRGEQSLSIPPLIPAPTAPTAPAPATEADEGPAPMLVAGIVLGAVGVTSLITGGVLGGISLSEADNAREDPTLCPNNMCTPAGRLYVDDAEAKGNASTALFVIGGLLSAGAATLIGVELGTRDKADDATAVVVPYVGPGAGGVVGVVQF